MSKCPKCNGDGFVVDKRKYNIKLECLDCREHWLDESRTCPKCKRPNGFAVPGLCSQCYSAQLSLK